MVFSLPLLVGVLAIISTAVFGQDENHGKESFLSMIQQRLDTPKKNLRSRVLSLQHENLDDIFDVCDLVQDHFEEALLLGDKSSAGSSRSNCDCSGTLKDTTEIQCSFHDVCDDFDLLCADIDLNVTLTGILDEQGRPGLDPNVHVSSCIDTDMVQLEKMCLSMDFSKPDFFLPSACSFSYGDSKCVCVIDDTVPCYNFDCSSAGKDLMSNTCQNLPLTGNGLDFNVLLSTFDGISSTVSSLEDSIVMEKAASQWMEAHESN